MSATFDLTTSVGKVRLLIPDPDISSPLFTDEEIVTFLSLEKQGIFRAAALALETAASNKTLSAIVAVRLSDGSSIGSSSGALEPLFARARELRRRAEEEEAREDGGAFAIAEIGNEIFAPVSIRRNALKRKSSW